MFSAQQRWCLERRERMFFWEGGGWSAAAAGAQGYLRGGLGGDDGELEDRTSYLVGGNGGLVAPIENVGI